MSEPGTNWSGTYRYRARTLDRPATIDDLREIVAVAARIRVLGTRHSFNDIADSDQLISLDALPSEVVVDSAAHTVTCNPSMTYGQLAAALNEVGLALHNLASLPHISVGGAVATATHGSGVDNGNLATAVAGLQLVTSTGDLVEARRGDADFDGMVVNLGALGVLTRITLDVQPRYDMRQVVYEAMRWDTLLDHFDDIMAGGYSVSAFTRWTGSADVWVKNRVDPDRSVESQPHQLFGAKAAVHDLHPVPGVDAENCTTQRGIHGLWSDRLPHFRMGFTPSSGDEIQSEFHVPRLNALAALRAVHGLTAAIEPHLLVSEIRCVAADTLWMSPQNGTDTVSLHFTWKPDAPAVDAALRLIETDLAPFAARPHWGKVFATDAATLASLYPRRDDFVQLADRLDPRGAFRNDWFERNLLGG